jgi:hypothetical protein
VVDLDGVKDVGDVSGVRRARESFIGVDEVVRRHLRSAVELRALLERERVRQVVVGNLVPRREQRLDRKPAVREVHQPVEQPGRDLARRRIRGGDWIEGGHAGVDEIERPTGTPAVVAALGSLVGVRACGVVPSSSVGFPGTLGSSGGLGVSTVLGTALDAGSGIVTTRIAGSPGTTR